MAQGHRRGLLPSARTQVSLNFALADLSRRFAQGQARRGVDPGIAARHGTNQAGALVAWVLFIAPVMGLFTVGAYGSPIAMLFVAPLNIIGMVILIRIHTAIIRPADQKLVYAIPTWILVVVGGAYVSGLFLLMIYRILSA